jgi:AraC-like DNA-binding protein
MKSDVAFPDPWSSCTVRSMNDMLAALADKKAQGTAVKTDQGWKRILGPGFGFREDYDKDIAKGGWEFYSLGNGIYLTIVDMVATAPIPRRHSAHDHLALSAVINAGVELLDSSGPIGELEDGYCTYYGMEAGTEFNTVYRPGCKLRWVSVFLDRKQLYSTLGLTPEELPADIRNFIDTGAPLPHTNVMMSPTADLAARQLIECPFTGGFRKAFLRAKAQELACYILYSLSSGNGEQAGDVLFTEEDYKKIYRAMRYLKHGLDEPANIPELAYAVGMTRQKLQLGFKLVFGNTVGRIRDNLRMEYALELVRSSDMPMIEIALETGYEHPASFTRAFKATYGMSPANMRRSALEAMSAAHKPARSG